VQLLLACDSDAFIAYGVEDLVSALKTDITVDGMGKRPLFPVLFLLNK
jgi:hypothetical protein